MSCKIRPSIISLECSFSGAEQLYDIHLLIHPLTLLIQKSSFLPVGDHDGLRPAASLCRHEKGLGMSVEIRL